MFIQSRGPLAACLLNDYVLKKLFVENSGAPWSSGAWGPGPNGPVVIGDVKPLLVNEGQGSNVIHRNCGLTLSLVSWVLLIAVLGFQNIFKPTKNDN